MTWQEADPCKALQCPIQFHPIDHCKIIRCCYKWRREAIERWKYEEWQKRFDETATKL